MRILGLLPIAALIIFLTGCKETIDYEKERQAIIDVINQETDAYLKRDFEAVYATHVHDTTNIRLTAGTDNYVFLEGWEEVKRHLSSDETEDDLSPELYISVEKSNYRIKICEESAFVVCDQIWRSAFENDTTEIKSIQVRFLEKVEDEWKISFVSWIGTSGYRDIEETEEL
ncbi:MAG: hypothetical protein EHM46_04295 [Bacteroidetes bacterium]|nr:MAG: hypothetical protein EHM46_04295 [Bacteroidota bacterium]